MRAFMNQFFKKYSIYDDIIEDENMHILNQPKSIINQLSNHHQLFWNTPIFKLHKSNDDLILNHYFAAGPDATSSEPYEQAPSPLLKLAYKSKNHQQIHLILSNLLDLSRCKCTNNYGYYSPQSYKHFPLFHHRYFQCNHPTNPRKPHFDFLFLIGRYPSHFYWGISMIRHNFKRSKRSHNPFE